MKVKKFRAASMAAVMEKIKNELGPDAVIMSSRQIKTKKGLFGLFSKKEYEVAVGYDDEPAVAFSDAARRVGLAPKAAPAGVPDVPAAAPSPGQGAEHSEDLNKSITELKDIVDKLQKRSAVPERTPDKRFSRPVMDLYRRMTANGVEEETADSICQRAEEVVIDRGADPEDVVRNIVEDTVGKPQLIEPVKYQRKTVMLVGPTGVGKTTTLIKLAYILVYQKNVNIGIINTDSFRVAAQEHMKSYCDILKTDMLTVYRPEEIGEALDAFRNKDVVLIDTPGKVSDDSEYQEDIRKLLDTGAIDEVYIALSASTSERVLRRIVENYSFLRRYSIIVTKTDEAPDAGVLLYLARVSGHPLSYMTTGQTVPDDIRAVNPEALADAILTPRSV